MVRNKGRSWFTALHADVCSVSSRVSLSGLINWPLSRGPLRARADPGSRGLRLCAAISASGWPCRRPRRSAGLQALLPMRNSTQPRLSWMKGSARCVFQSLLDQLLGLRQANVAVCQRIAERVIGVVIVGLELEIWRSSRSIRRASPVFRPSWTCS